MIQLTCDIGSLLGAIVTFITLYLLYIQIRKQGKRDKADLTLGLYKDFFNNQTFLKIFAFLDFDNLKKAENNAKQIIENDQENENHNDKNLSEKEISYYLNYFNSIGYLIKSKIVSEKDIREIFNYQIKKTFSNYNIIKYAIDGNFKHINSLKISNEICFFFYGTLMNIDDRIRHIGNWATKKETQAKLVDYCKSEINYKSDIYPSIIKETNSIVNGVYLEFTCNYNETFLLFKNIDDYEMEGSLYIREWVSVFLNNSEKKHCWTYVGI